MARKKILYDEDAIQTLDALEHIRLRTGMYIGRIGDGSNPSDGIYVMLKEVIDNSVDAGATRVGRARQVRGHEPRRLFPDSVTSERFEAAKRLKPIARHARHMTLALLANHDVHIIVTGQSRG